MIDEYQDTNRLQESILMKLTSPERKNLFMVGDVKQSIYRFREADPTLFLGKYQNYRQGSDGEAIVLGENFRSMTNVTSFTNILFEQLMDREVGEIDYDEDAHLKYAHLITKKIKIIRFTQQKCYCMTLMPLIQKKKMLNMRMIN